MYFCIYLGDDSYGIDPTLPETESKAIIPPYQVLAEYKSKNVCIDSPREVFHIDRMQDPNDIKLDIMGCYKSGKRNLKATPRIIFENETGVGSGPVSEFLNCSIKLVTEGFDNMGKTTLFFEGEKDHKIPVHNTAVRQAGGYRAIGKIIGHCILHGGPLLYGLSESVIDFWVTGSHSEIVLQDVADTELRELLEEV